MATRYRVLVGINYGRPERRAEPGDVVDDLLTRDIEWMLNDGIIEPVKE